MTPRDRPSPSSPPLPCSLVGLVGLVALVAAASSAACDQELACACPSMEQLDAGPNTTIDAAPDGGPQQLDSVANITINGVTDDGLIVYTTPAGGIWSVPFTANAVPVELSPPADSVDAGVYSWGAVVQHHVVVMSMHGPASGPAWNLPDKDALVWDERTGVTTTFPPPGPAVEILAGTLVSADSQSIVMQWEDSTTSATQSFVAKIDGTDRVSFGPASTLAFDEEKLVYSTLVDAYVGAPGGSLVVLDGANGWSSTTLSTNASGYAVDAIGGRALVSTGPSPNGGQGVLLAALDGGAGTVIDPTGGGPMVFLSSDSTLAMYTAEAGTANAHVVAVALPLSGPPGVPYGVPGAHLSASAGGGVTLAPDAPGGPVALITASTDTELPSPLAIVGVGAGATSPNLAVPSSYVDGFTSDQSRALINRPTTAAQNGTMAALSVFELPAGPESAPLSASSYGWLGLGGSKVLFTDQFLGGPYDLRVADLSKGTSSTLVVSQIVGYALSPDLTKVAFTYSDGATTTGLWITTLPTDL